MKGCLYEVDPRHLNQEQQEMIGGQVHRHIASNAWSWSEPAFVQYLCKIISEHYDNHKRTLQPLDAENQVCSLVFYERNGI